MKETVATRTASEGPILITDSDLGPPVIEREACRRAGLELAEARCRTEAEVVRAVSKFRPSGLLVQYAPITAQVLSRCDGVRAVARYGVGLDCIDIDAATRAGIDVLNVPDYGTDEVADHALALALTLLRNLFAWTALTRAGDWSVPGLASAPRSFDTTTIGLAGFGRIARGLCARVQALGTRVIAHDPFASAASVRDGGADPVGWSELWERSNLVSLHMPLTETTERIVDDHALALMQPGSYLVNTARAALVDRAAIERALASGVLAGIAVDVWWHEPPDREDALLRHPRVVATPHVAYLSAQSLPRLRRLAVERLIARIRGADPNLAETTGS